MTITGMTSLDPSLEISIGIVTYNKAELLDRCLRSIAIACQSVSHEVIVVDNASTDNAVEVIQQRHPHVTLLQNSRNVGLTHGVNQILSLFRGRYFLLLDNDTEVEPIAILTLLRFQHAHPDVGIAAPKLVYPDGAEQGAAKAFPTPMAALFGRRSLLRRLAPNNSISRRYLLSAYANATEPYEVDSVSAACMLLRREVIEQTGGMDENFFVYWSDVDWCRRIKQRDWKVVVIPSVRVIHFESLKLAKQRPQAIIDFHRGAYLCYCKHEARSFVHPMRAMAFIGLFLRSALLLAVNAFRAPTMPTPGTRIILSGHNPEGSS